MERSGIARQILWRWHQGVRPVRLQNPTDCGGRRRLLRADWVSSSENGCWKRSGLRTNSDAARKAQLRRATEKFLREMRDEADAWWSPFKLDKFAINRR